MDAVFLALRVLLSLGVVLVLLWMVHRRLTRKTRSTRSTDVVTVVTRQGIGQKASVVVVDVSGTRYLLGVTEQNVNVLGSGDAPVAVPAAEAFAESMSEATLGKADLALITGAAKRPAITSSGRLGGSILSPGIWKQTATIIRQGLGR